MYNSSNKEEEEEEEEEEEDDDEEEEEEEEEEERKRKQHENKTSLVPVMRIHWCGWMRFKKTSSSSSYTGGIIADGTEEEEVEEELEEELEERENILIFIYTRGNVVLNVW